jgi:hypothetical protein
MDKKAGQRPKIRTWFHPTGIILLTLLIGSASYLGCGSPPEPPPVKVGAKPGPPATPPPEPSGEDMTLRGSAKTAKLDRFRVIDRILEQLPVGNIAFNAPEAIGIDDTASIQLVLALGKSVEELKQMVEAEGEKQGASIKVSNQMEARLTGPHFQIHAVTPEIQGITTDEVTKWAWEVKPLKDGPQKLHLTLSAKFTVQGQPTSRTIRTFDKTVEVNVAWGQKVSNFWEKFGQWLWAGIIIPVAGWLWKRRKGFKVNTGA